MQRLFIITLAAVVVLAVGFCTLIILSLLPYFAFIGKVATGVVVILLGCIAALMISFTWSRIGVWAHRRRTIIAGDVVAYIRADEIVHLSAEHEKAKVPLPQLLKALPAPKSVADRETVLELHDKGVSLRNIAEATGLTYYEVQRITSGK